MKFFIAILFFTISAHSFELIDSKKFQSLSREQQIRYLNEVQKIVVGITKKSSYSAEVEKNESRNPANSRPNLDDWASPDVAFAAPPTTVSNPEPTTPKPEQSTQAATVTKPPKLETAKIVKTATGSPKAESKSKAQPKAKSKTETTHFRCMHTGFVVKKDPCTGYQKIPDWMGIDGVIEKNKSCQTGFSVCNPIIFGLQFDNPDKCKSLLDGECSKTAKPFCARRGLWPTEECHKMATANSNNGTAVAAEISSQIKPSLYEEFKKDMEVLCDPEKIKTNPFAEYRNGVKRSDKTAQAVRDDLAQTCGWATKQLNLLNETVVDNKQLNNSNSLKPAPESADQK